MKSKDKAGFEIIEHLSDVGIKAWSESLNGLFETCALGMFSIICNISLVKPVLKKKIHFKQECDFNYNCNLDDILILWLERLLYLHEVNKLLFSSFEVLKFDFKKDSYNFLATAFGEKINLNFHEIFVSIKAPTYHMLEVKKDENENLWYATVIFDV